MRLSCDFDELVSNLSDISEVVEDRLVDADARNVIFHLTPEGMELIGVNKLITFKRRLSEEFFTYDGDSEVYLQMCNKELIDFLNSYKNLKKTKVEEVSMEVAKEGFVLCKVLERDTDTNNPTVGSWSFRDIPIRPNLMPRISQQKPEKELQTIDTSTILLYTDCLGSLLQAGTSLYSNLIFGEDKVVVFSSAHLSLMSNVLGDEFKHVKMSYRVIGFLGKVLCKEPQVGVARLENSLYLKTETSEAFVMYDSNIPDYQLYVNAFKKDHAITLDRVYLRDVIRRFKLMNEAVEFTINLEENTLTLKNSKFEQSISLMRVKDMDSIEKRKFKIMPEVLDKAIIGSDEEFSDELFIYYCMQENKTAVLEFADDSGTWFSSVNIKPY